jgi:multicomponent Na+:H+ antiporter subunit E
MARLLMLALAVVVTWLVWSGLYKPLLFGLGAVSVGLTLWLAVRMDLTNRTYFALDLLPRMLGYWAWLVKEIVISNFTIAKIILSPSLPIAPNMVKLEVPTKGPIGQATLANSITLTPCTLTIDAHDDRFIVHCLTTQSAAELEAGEMGRRVVRAVAER